MQDSLAIMLFRYSLDLLYGAPLDALLDQLETWPADYVPIAKA